MLEYILLSLLWEAASLYAAAIPYTDEGYERWKASCLLMIPLQERLHEMEQRL